MEKAWIKFLMPLLALLATQAKARGPLGGDVVNQCNNSVALKACYAQCSISHPKLGTCSAGYYDPNCKDNNNCNDNCWTTLSPNCFPNETMGQSSATYSAAKLSEQASAQKAAIGVVSLADGVNHLDQDFATAGILIENGQQSLAIADELKKAEAQGKKSTNAMQSDVNAESLKVSLKLVGDPSVLNSPQAKNVFSTLEEKYGMEKADFIEKMLASRGSQNSLEEVLGGKLGEKISKALATSSSISGEDKEKIVSASAVAEVKPESTYELTGSVRPKTSLRDSLRKKLEEETKQDEEAQGKSAAETISKRPDPEPKFSLNPVDASPEEIFGIREPATEELTLFDVVKQKYMEKSAMMQASGFRDEKN